MVLPPLINEGLIKEAASAAQTPNPAGKCNRGKEFSVDVCVCDP